MLAEIFMLRLEAAARAAKEAAATGSRFVPVTLPKLGAGCASPHSAVSRAGA